MNTRIFRDYAVCAAPKNGDAGDVCLDFVTQLTLFNALSDNITSSGINFRIRKTQQKTESVKTLPIKTPESIILSEKNHLCKPDSFYPLQRWFYY